MTAREVSVVIPVFNRPHLVEASIGSIQIQQNVDVEILVVDDGSTDTTRELIARLAEADPRIKLIVSDHRGPAAARNLGVAAAGGDYLTFLDSDDLCPPGRIRRQIDKLRDRPDVAAVIGAIQGFEAIDAFGEPLPDLRYGRCHDAALHSAMFRLRDFRRFGPLDEGLTYAEDVDYFLRLLEADARLLLEADVALYVRFHAGNMVRDLTARQRGHVQAYARSIARRRAAGRTTPLKSFFSKTFACDVEYGGSTV